MTFSARKSTRQSKTTFSCGFYATFQGFKSPHSDHNAERPATVVVAGFLYSCGFADFSVSGIYARCEDYFPLLRYKNTIIFDTKIDTKTGPIRSRLFIPHTTISFLS